MTIKYSLVTCTACGFASKFNTLLLSTHKQALPLCFVLIHFELLINKTYFTFQ